MEGVRIILVGGAASELCLAAGLARKLGADVVLTHSIDEGISLALCRGAQLMLVEVTLDVGDAVARLQAERIAMPVFACGVSASAEQAVAAIRAGARDYVPLPPEPELIAAMLRDLACDPVPPVRTLVGQTMEDVERALILETLDRCGGNRTIASNILGISVRTMRNKLKAFSDAGFAVAPAV